MMELLKYVELSNQEEETKAEREKMERWLDYLSLVHSSPFGDGEARKKFVDLIKPDSVGSKEIPQYETDIKLLERLKAAQEGGKPFGNN